jgi:hypothetical protein
MKERCDARLEFDDDQSVIGSFVRRLTVKYGRRYWIECARQGKPLDSTSFGTSSATPVICTSMSQ